jgi:hypothetical protein
MTVSDKQSMRKLTFIFLTVFFLLLSYAVTQINKTAYSVEPINDIKPVSSLPFKKGEKITFDVKYKNIKTGSSTLTFNGIKVLNGREVYSADFVTQLPAMTDREELYADKITFLPVEVHREIKKIKAFTTEMTEKYDQEAFRVDIIKKSTFLTKKLSIQKDAPIHNAILLTYFFRMKERFDKDETLRVTFPTAEFTIGFEGEETISTPLGEHTAYVFNSDPSKFKFWLSADEQRTPLKIENPGALGYSLVIRSVEY